MNGYAECRISQLSWSVEIAPLDTALTRSYESSAVTMSPSQTTEPCQV